MAPKPIVIPPPLAPLAAPAQVPAFQEMPAEALVVSPYTPAAAVSIPDVDAVLRLAAMVEQAILKGNGLALENQFDQARREYRTALALNPACLDAQLGLAYLCFSQGQLDLALEHYQRCLKIDPASADAHYGMGRVLLETDRIDEAVTEFQQTLTLDPTFDDARETLTSLGAAA
jgi:tetratricopeptide (TPR) repeat protein